MKKFIIVLITIAMLINAVTLPTFAEDATPSLCLNAVNHIIHEFYIDSNGFAEVLAEYYGYPSYFVSATITIKIQKRFLGVFWQTVDIGQPDNVWTYTSTEYASTCVRSTQLTDKGTYRAVFTYEFVGTNGNDELEETVTYTYE